MDPSLEPVLVSREELLARRDGGRPFWETQWILRADGALTQLPNPAAGGVTRVGMGFVDEAFAKEKDPLAADLRGAFGAAALARLARPLLRHHGDLLGATFAERHFAQLGRDASDAALRQFLVLPEEPATDVLRRRTRLDRELAVRLLHERGTRNARGELAALAKSDDPFLRHAAAEALAAFDGTDPPAPVRLDCAALAPPPRVDLWLWIGCSRMPSRPDVVAAARQAASRIMWSQLIGGGGRVDNIILSNAQFKLDRPDELPYEAARRWGRARVDECLIGLRADEAGTRCRSSSPQRAAPSRSACSAATSRTGCRVGVLEEP